DIALDKIGGSSLVDSDFDSNGDLKSEIPPTYQPARNTIFLSIALAYAETLKVDEIFIGTNTLDYSGYPDCRTEYIKAYEKLANLATKRATEDNKKIQIQTPLALMDKKEIILEGDRLGVDFKLTNSCYFPLKFGIPCGDCDSCHIRAKGFKLAMLIDPLIKED
ncbi:MAG: 7-cyano-7-deazaguanine synthase, partial [Nitrospinota bacterium]